MTHLKKIIGQDDKGLMPIDVINEVRQKKYRVKDNKPDEGNPHSRLMDQIISVGKLKREKKEMERKEMEQANVAGMQGEPNQKPPQVPICLCWALWSFVALMFLGMTIS
eukprot:771892_1